jgi:hypothetical protein
VFKFCSKTTSMTGYSLMTRPFMDPFALLDFSNMADMPVPSGPYAASPSRLERGAHRYMPIDVKEV